MRQNDKNHNDNDNRQNANDNHNDDHDNEDATTTITTTTTETINNVTFLFWLELISSSVQKIEPFCFWAASPA
jgi:hypothetical protein